MLNLDDFWKSGKDKITAMLIENGADINLKTEGGRTAMQLAEEKGTEQTFMNRSWI